MTPQAVTGFGSTRSTWRAVLCAAMTLAVLLALSSDANAHLLTHNDANDVSSPFDIRSATLARDGGLLRAHVRTYDLLRDRHFATGDAFLVRLDTRGDGRTDFTLRLEYYEGAYPYCWLYDSNGYARAGGQAVKRDRSFSCSIGWEYLEATRHIRWRIDAYSEGRLDRAPNRGWYGH